MISYCFVKLLEDMVTMIPCNYGNTKCFWICWMPTSAQKGLDMLKAHLCAKKGLVILNAYLCPTEFGHHECLPLPKRVWSSWMPTSAQKGLVILNVYLFPKRLGYIECPTLQNVDRLECLYHPQSSWSSWMPTFSPKLLFILNAHLCTTIFWSF